MAARWLTFGLAVLAVLPQPLCAGGPRHDCRDQLFRSRRQGYPAHLEPGRGQLLHRSRKPESGASRRQRRRLRGRCVQSMDFDFNCGGVGNPRRSTGGRCERRQCERRRGNHYPAGRHSPVREKLSGRRCLRRRWGGNQCPIGSGRRQREFLLQQRRLRRSR